MHSPAGEKQREDEILAIGGLDAVVFVRILVFRLFSPSKI